MNTNKIDLIKAEVEKLKSQLLRGACSSQVAMETRCKEEAYNEVLAILDSMQEEPVSEELEEVSKNYALNNTPWDDCKDEIQEAFKDGAKWQKLKDMGITNNAKGVVTNILNSSDKSLDIYATEVAFIMLPANLTENYHMTNRDRISDAVRLGAEWQKTKDESTTEDLGEYINELSKQFPEVSFAKLSRIAVRVAKWQKEQMMAKAIDGYVIEDIEEGNGDFLLSADYLPKSMGLKDRQKVKVIVIKEADDEDARAFETTEAIATGRKDV